MKILAVILVSMISLSVAAESPQVVMLTNGAQLYCTDHNKLSLVSEAIEDMRAQAAAVAPLIVEENKRQLLSSGTNIAIEATANDYNNISIRIYIDGNSWVINRAIKNGSIKKRERNITIINSECVLSR